MRTRLLLVLVGVVALVLAVHDLPLAAHLDRVERDRLVTKLERDAFILAGRLEEGLEDGTAADQVALQALVTRYGAEEEVRVVVVDADATAVVGTEADAGEDFSNRPEIDTALDGRPTTGERESVTLGEGLFFVAVPVLSGDDVVGAVRLSAPERVVDDRAADRVRGLFVVAINSLLIATGAALILSWSVTRPLARLRATTLRLADGDLSARAATDDGPPEVRDLAGAFNRTADRLEDLIDRQKSFAGTASHQLRTPLTALRLRLEQLAERVGDDEVASRRVGDAIGEADRLHRMIEGLLLLSRAEQAGTAIRAVDLGALAEERVAHWSPLAAERDVRLVADVAERVEAQALPGAVEQIVDNLVDNALEVSPAAATVTVAVRPSGATAELHVVDEGPGLSAEDRERAFDRFWRAADSAPGGSGLGLSIVRQLAVASGGEASLREAVGGGIDATVTLPLARPRPDATSRP
jgi:signal transduction histidine kinase